MKSKTVFCLGFALAVLISACSSAPELGDLRYIEGQRSCLVMNLADAGIEMFPNDTHQPTEAEWAEARDGCRQLGYEWTYVQLELAKRIEVLQVNPASESTQTPSEISTQIQEPTPPDANVLPTPVIAPVPSARVP